MWEGLEGDLATNSVSRSDPTIWLPSSDSISIVSYTSQVFGGCSSEGVTIGIFCSLPFILLDQWGNLWLNLMGELGNYQNDQANGICEKCPDGQYTCGLEEFF